MKFLLALLVTLLQCASTFAGVGPVPGTERIAPVFQEADVVCNCVVRSVHVLSEQKRDRFGKPFTWRRLEASVEVIDAYKQPEADKIKTDLKVVFEDEIPTTGMSPTLSQTESGLMFLKTVSPENYVFADPFLGVTRFAELPIPQGGAGMPRLETALAQTLHQNNRNDQISALRLLEGFDHLSPETLTNVAVADNSADPAVALASIAVLLKAKLRGSVSVLADYLHSHTLTTVPEAILSIGGELTQVSDARELAALESLTASDILSIKLGAMAGLRKVHGPASAKALVERLDDPNSDVRFMAVITLSEIFSKNGDYAPSMYSFDQNPDFYINEWKAWWAGEGSVYH